MRSTTYFAGACAILFIMTGCGSMQPAGDTSMGELLLEMSDALRDMQEETALLQAQVDSLREQMARQDTVLRRLASMAGMPMPGP
jgi:hypothetical protein